MSIRRPGPLKMFPTFSALDGVNRRLRHAELTGNLSHVQLVFREQGQDLLHLGGGQLGSRSLFSLPCSALAACIRGISGWSAEEKMIGINTGTDITCVTHVISEWNPAAEQHPGDAVGDGLPAFEKEAAVATFI
ncbi:MAG: hypothetical protein WA738_03245 [Candidatus Angelobacter sp.]